MPAELITFRGTTIYTTGTDGAGWDFKPSPMGREYEVVSPAQGIGHFIKKGNIPPVIHTLEIAWYGRSVENLVAMLSELADGEFGTLVVPSRGSWPQCILKGFTQIDAKPSDIGTVCKTTLTFEQFP